MPYEFLDDLAVADVQFRATGRDLPEVFRAAADATLNVMVADLASVEPRGQRRVELESDALDLLLFELLQELVYYKDAEQLLLRAREVDIEEVDGHFRLEALLEGERLDSTRHEQGVDVKAVTLHRFTLERTAAGDWQAVVILDI